MDDLSKMTARARHHVTEDGRIADGSSGGGGGTFYVDAQDFAGLRAKVYADAALTTPFTYEQGKAMMASPFVIVAVLEGQLTAVTSFASIALDGLKQIQTNLAVVSDGGLGSQVLMLDFSDTPVD